MEFINTTSDDGMNLVVSYDGSCYTVVVSKNHIKKEAKVSCSFTPTFGMDILDRNNCLAKAEELAQQIDLEIL